MNNKEAIAWRKMDKYYFLQLLNNGRERLHLLKTYKVVIDLGTQFRSEIIVLSTFSFWITGITESKLHSAYFSYQY